MAQMTPQMTPQQCRAARALLGITQFDLANQATLSEKVINMFERGWRVSPDSVECLQRSLKRSGITFLFDNGVPSGVTLGNAAPISEDQQPSPMLFRVARSWLNWTHNRLAKQAGVSPSTVRDFESRRHVPRADNLTAVELAIRLSGVQFLFDGNKQAIGIRVHNGVALTA